MLGCIMPESLHTTAEIQQVGRTTRQILARLAGENRKTHPELRTRLGIDHIHPPIHACGQLMHHRKSDTGADGFPCQFVL